MDQQSMWDVGWGSSTFNDAQLTGDRTYDAQRIILVRVVGAAALIE